MIKNECRIPININHINYKLLDPNNKENIEYIPKKPHKCKTENFKQNEIPENCSTKEDLIKKAKNLIKLNPLNSLIYHQFKLHENKIFLPDEKVRRIIKQLRNNLFPKDKDIMDLLIVTITFDDKVKDAKNLPFCPVYSEFKNPTKENRQESFIILTIFFSFKNFKYIFK